MHVVILCTAAGNDIYIFSTYVDFVPHFSQLHILNSSSGKVVKVRESVCAQWDVVATHLIFEPSVIDIIKKNNNTVEESFDDMMKQWLNGTKGTRLPIKWSTLVAVFREIDRNTLATDLENILPEVLQSEK